MNSLPRFGAMLRISIMNRYSAMLLILACSLILSSCSQGPKKEPGKIRIQLNWFPDSQHGGIYAALLNGHYEKEGLDVEIIPGGPGVGVEAKVDLGRVEFGIANAHRILLKRNEGAKITALFACLQNSPRCIMVHKESGIEKFEDLAGVTLAVGSDTAFYKYMQQKVELKNVKLVSYSGSNAAFLSDKSYAQQAYSISEPILVKRKGANPVSLMLSDLGFNPYTSCVFASEKTVAENPEMVKKFLRATRKGWEDYVKNPESANKEMEKINKEHDLQALNEGEMAARELCQPTSSTEIGSMTNERWSEIVSQLQAIGMLKEDFEMGKAYSTEYLPE